MKKKTIFVLSFIFILSGLALAQDDVKTVTNADLEKYKQKRLAAERDLAENYAEMGFPSPEEILRQNEESRRELNEFADQLRRERIARERLQRRNNTTVIYQDQDYDDDIYHDNGFIDYSRFSSGGYFYSNGRYYRRDHRRKGGRYYRRNDFRSRFIRDLPDFIRRTHRFNTFDTGRRFTPARRGTIRRPGKRK
jgi:hypothetical protein